MSLSILGLEIMVGRSQHSPWKLYNRVKLDLKKNTSEQVTGKLESGAPATREPVLSGKGTKFCRECGAKILRDSMYCEECGARLGRA